MALLGRAMVTGDHRQVSRGQIMVQQFSWLDPSQGNVFVGMGLGGPGGQRADKGDHFDDDGVIVMQERRERSNNGDGAAELLVDFANDGGGGGLAGFDLTAGKFPF